MSPPIIIAILIGLGVDHFLPSWGFITFLAKAAIVAVTYLVSVFFMGLYRSERSAAINFVSKKLKK